MRHEVIADLVAKHIPEKAYPEQWDAKGLHEALQQVLNLDLPITDWAKEEGIADDEVRERITRAADAAMAAKVERFGPDVMRQVEKAVLLQTLDHLWREHLVTLDHLRQVIGFRGYAQRDPLNEYKTEAFELFEAMLGRLREVVTSQLMRVEVVQRPPPDCCRKTISRRWRRTSSIRSPARTRWPWTPAATDCRSRRPRRAERQRRDRPQRSYHLGQGAAQRALPLRLGQEVQALPRPLRLSRAR